MKDNQKVKTPSFSYGELSNRIMCEDGWSFVHESGNVLTSERVKELGMGEINWDTLLTKEN